ncbi:MAG: hypothetical protein ACP5N3_05890 [Candidatus Nanoarchaeia archaeon]
MKETTQINKSANNTKEETRIIHRTILTTGNITRLLVTAAFLTLSYFKLENTPALSIILGTVISLFCIILIGLISLTFKKQLITPENYFYDKGYYILLIGAALLIFTITSQSFMNRVINFSIGLIGTLLIIWSSVILARVIFNKYKENKKTEKENHK